MADNDLEELIRKADGLSHDLRLQLLEHVRRTIVTGGKPTRHWREISGAATYPLLGEDAQVWVSRGRAEGDEHRQRQLRKDQ